MISVAVCDDNKEFLKMLVKSISAKLSKNGVDYKISEFTGGKDFLRYHMDKHCDVVFLDITMPEMDGFLVAKEIRRISEKTYIIFVTMESGLVYDSLDFRPFHFIPKCTAKSLFESRLESVINKLLLHMKVNKSICFDLAYGEKLTLAPADIISIRSNANYVEIDVVNANPIRIREQINSVMDRLSPDVFSRVHNRCVVNMKRIRKIDYPNNEIIMDNGQVIDVSRTYKKSLEEAYGLFLRKFG